MKFNIKISLVICILIAFSFISGCSEKNSSRVEKKNDDGGILKMLYDDMHAGHAGKPHGVPADYNWYAGPVYKNLVFPTTTYYSKIGPHQWNAITIWGQVYEAAEGTGSKNTRVEIKNIDCYYLSIKDNKWHQVQFPTSLTGAGYAESFSTNDAIEPDSRMEDTTSLSVIPGNGYNYHFYPNGRAEVEPDDVKAICGSVNARLIPDNKDLPDDRDKAKFLLNMGCDFWYDISAPWDNFQTNGDTGIGRFKYVKNEWQLFTMYSAREGTDILSCPPPPIAIVPDK